MPLTLQKIAARRARVVFTYEGEAVTLDYYPERVTANLQTRLTEIHEMAGRQDADADEAKHKVDALLCDLVAAWDLLTTEDGPPVPLTPEALFPLSIDFEGRCIVACIQDARMGEQNGARPSAPSALHSSPAGMPQVSRRKSRNGTH